MRRSSVRHLSRWRRTWRRLYALAARGLGAVAIAGIGIGLGVGILGGGLACKKGDGDTTPRERPRTGPKTWTSTSSKDGDDSTPSTGVTLEEAGGNCAKIKEGTISVDGLRDDWSGLPSRMLGSKTTIVGGDAGKWSGKDDFSAKLICGHNAGGMYFLVEVTDDKVVRGAKERSDRLEFVYRTAADAVGRLVILPPSASSPKPKVSWLGGFRPAKGQVTYQIIRLPKGWAIELAVKPGGFPGYVPGAVTVPLSIRLHDFDGAAAVDTIFGTGGDLPGKLGRIEYDTTRRMLAEYLRRKNFKKSDIKYYHVGNYVTGKPQEQLVVAGKEVALLGEDLGPGGGFSFMPIPFASGPDDLSDFKQMDLDGNGALDFIVTVRQRNEQGFERKVLVVLRYTDDNKWDVFFMQELEKRFKGKALVNEVKFVPQGKKVLVEVSFGSNTGWVQAGYPNTAGQHVQAIITPWDKEKKKVYEFKRSGFIQK